MHEKHCMPSNALFGRGFGKYCMTLVKLCIACMRQTRSTTDTTFLSSPAGMGATFYILRRQVRQQRISHRRYAPATSAWQQYLRQLHQLGSRICAGFISLAAALAPASPAWQQHLRRLHQPGSSISASFTSLAAALAPALSAC